MKIFGDILNFLESNATGLPLELLVVVGSFVEEVIAPIPSPIVMVLAGTLTYAQNQPLWYLSVLALFGALGKTLGAWVLYVVADKLEDVVVGKFGRFLGISHKEVESIGKKLNGGWQDNVFLFIARAIPIIPSAPVSIACGAVKLNKKTFLSSTFAGTFFRNLMYLYLGYAGLGNYKEISQGFERFESIGQLLLLVIITGVIIWAYYKRRKTHHQ
ncbi:VTT domain-containing protein [Patescibacteria group bacterium]|nr:VTT domain-containing protein [Patescibacteria group bacterium]